MIEQNINLIVEIGMLVISFTSFWVKISKRLSVMEVKMQVLFNNFNKNETSNSKHFDKLYDKIDKINK